MIVILDSNTALHSGVQIVHIDRIQKMEVYYWERNRSGRRGVDIVCSILDADILRWIKSKIFAKNGISINVHETNIKNRAHMKIKKRQISWKGNKRGSHILPSHQSNKYTDLTASQKTRVRVRNTQKSKIQFAGYYLDHSRTCSSREEAHLTRTQKLIMRRLGELNWIRKPKKK